MKEKMTVMLAEMEIPCGRVTIQKDRARYTLQEQAVDRGNSSPRYMIQSEVLFETGHGSGSYRYTGEREALEFLIRMMDQGFKKFQNAREVSWYATVENNTDREEVWEVQGDWLVPIKSGVLDD